MNSANNDLTLELVKDIDQKDTWLLVGQGNYIYFKISKTSTGLLFKEHILGENVFASLTTDCHPRIADLTMDCHPRNDCHNLVWLQRGLHGSSKDLDEWLKLVDIQKYDLILHLSFCN